MSEFSESYHFLARPAFDSLEPTLRDAGLTGVLFASDGKWRTFVPFAHDGDIAYHDSVLGRLAAATGGEVLCYQFMEDYFWAFVIATAQGPVNGYSCSWQGRVIEIDDGALDLERLEPLLEPTQSIEALRELLTPRKPTRRGQQRASTAFAQAIGLTRFSSVGPTTIEIDLEEIRAQGTHAIIGSPSPAMPDLASGWQREALALPETAITVLEGLELVTAHAQEWANDATLVQCDTNLVPVGRDQRFARGPWIDEQGRVAPSGGVVGYFVSRARQEYRMIALVVEERALFFSTYEVASSGNAPVAPTSWLDSPAIIGITEPLYLAWRTEQTPPLFDRFLVLVPHAENPIWKAIYYCAELNGLARTVVFEVSAVDGRVCAMR